MQYSRGGAYVESRATTCYRDCANAQVPDEDIVRVYGPDGLVEAIEVRDRTFMMGVQWHPEYFAGERSMGCIFKTLSMEASKARSREERLREKGLHIERQDAGGRWPSIHFADCI